MKEKRMIIPDIWYCDNRPFSETKPRYWGIAIECRHCHEFYKTAKETTKEKAEKLSVNLGLCVECE